jgi:D-threo-aldose 1-dehydrogenase
LQFPLSSPIVASVLIGTAKASSLERNMSLFEPTLPPGLYAEFEDLTLIAPPLGEAAVRV